MTRFTITISLRDAQRAQVLISDNRYLEDVIEQTSTNVWESVYNEFMDEEQVEEILDDIELMLDCQEIEYDTMRF